MKINLTVHGGAMGNNNIPTWPEYQSLKEKEKGSFLLDDSGVINSFLYSQQVSTELLDKLFSVTQHLQQFWHTKELRKYLSTLLVNKNCSLYFTQCSTRTFTSFSFAAKALGMSVEEVRDPELSALYKGESELDTVLVLASLSDLLVMRTMDGKVIERASYEFAKRGIKTKIINAGSGPDQHPTQALLELFTILSSLDIFSSENQYKVAFIGDLKRSRTVRSLSYLLALYPHIEHVFIAPDELQIGDDLTNYLDEKNIKYFKSSSLESQLLNCDVFYMMRMQDEYSETSEELRNMYKKYFLTTEMVDRMKDSACIIHPLPRRSELPIEIDCDRRAKYWKAVKNGLLVRVALILYMFGYDDVNKLKAMTYE